MNEYKIVIVDDHELIVNGIINALSTWPRFHVIAHIDNGRDIYNSCIRHQPDILILDLGLPEMSGMDIIPQIRYRWSAMSILVYTAYEEEYMAIRALAAGATGYVLKKSSQQVLMAALQMMAVKKRFIDPALNKEAIHLMLLSEKQNQQLLTTRERQILKLINESNTNRLISEKLCISIKTVETHRLNMMRKLNVHKVTELLHSARCIGLVD
ncbi:two component system response regulator [Kosakonia sp. CCTCC M2018092]|uniref:two component system response regulator n=1 Tax=Kosakonia sp. CCTCC M2018092 TaxID=2492396 RepID=UPI000F60FE13|nr:two component system response regulator [Kosakonia sp. CCTCC M2018092]AZI89613.1 two component system response regulator [Kosakonia sp. CCTCC M2018092]